MAITIVQHAGGTSTVNSTAVAFGSNNTSGNAIFVAAGAIGGSFPVGGCTLLDTKLNTYNQIQLQYESGFINQSWIATGIAGGANTVTVSITGGVNDLSVVIVEISGLVASPVDVTNNSGSGSGGSPISTGSVTGTYAVELYIATCAAFASGSTPTINSSFGILESSSTSNFESVASLITSSITTTNPAFTFGAGSYFLASIVGLQGSTVVASTLRLLPLTGVGK